MRLKLINPKHYYNKFKQFLKFAIAPVYKSTHELTIAQKVEETWAMFVVKMILAVLVGVLIGVLYDPENLTTSSLSERFSPTVLFLVTVFALPLFEETAFRLSLKFKPIYLALTLGVLGYYIASKAIYFAKLSDVNDSFEPRVIIALSILLITYPLFSIVKVKKRLEAFWQNNFRWILYVSSFGFAWMHIFNYELTLEHLLMMPIITLPKLVNALCYGYVRINYGFIYAFLIHILTNCLAFVVNMLSNGD